MILQRYKLFENFKFIEILFSIFQENYHNIFLQRQVFPVFYHFEVVFFLLRWETTVQIKLYRYRHYTDSKVRFEDIFTMEIPQWIINPYGDIDEPDVVLQK